MHTPQVKKYQSGFAQGVGGGRGKFWQGGVIEGMDNSEISGEVMEVPTTYVTQWMRENVSVCMFVINNVMHLLCLTTRTHVYVVCERHVFVNELTMERLVGRGDVAATGQFGYPSDGRWCTIINNIFPPQVFTRTHGTSF